MGERKRLQECDGEGFSLAGGCGGRVSCRGNMREVITWVYRLSSTFLERYRDYSFSRSGRTSMRWRDLLLEITGFLNLSSSRIFKRVVCSSIYVFSDSSARCSARLIASFCLLATALGCCESSSFSRQTLEQNTALFPLMLGIGPSQNLQAFATENAPDARG